jgi:hypothetical protein
VFAQAQSQRLNRSQNNDFDRHRRVAPSIVNRVLRQPGKPLDPITYAATERKGDLDGLRIHDDNAAGSSAQSIGARAYTVGKHVVFGAGEYQPGSDRTNRLLAHELAHVQQQRGAHAAGGPLEIEMDRDGPWEREARSAAMTNAPVTGHAPIVVQRDAGTPPPTNAPVRGPTDAGVSSSVDAAPADRGAYTIAGLSQRKQALLGAGGTTHDMAIAMLETEHMSAAEYPYGDSKQSDSANFGIFRQNWHMIRNSVPQYSSATAANYSWGSALNTNLSWDVQVLHASQTHFGARWFAGHRNGESGLLNPAGADISRYRNAVQWIFTELNLHPAYRTDDTRVYVDVPPI